MHRRKQVFAIIGFILATVLAVAAQDFVGTWEGTSNDGQNDYPMSLTIHKDAGAWKGSIFVNGEDIPLDNLKIKGDTISFEANVEGNTYKVEGTMNGNTISGTFSGTDNRSGNWTATRKNENGTGPTGKKP